MSGSMDVLCPNEVPNLPYYLKNMFSRLRTTKQFDYCCFCFLFCLGRLSSVTTLKLNDNCLSSLPFSIGGYRLFFCVIDKAFRK